MHDPPGPCTGRTRRGSVDQNRTKQSALQLQLEQQRRGRSFRGSTASTATPPTLWRKSGGGVRPQPPRPSVAFETLFRKPLRTFGVLVWRSHVLSWAQPRLFLALGAMEKVPSGTLFVFLPELPLPASPAHVCRLPPPSRPALGLDDPPIPIPFFPSVTDDCLVPALSRSHPRLALLSVVPQDASVSPEDAPTLRSNDPGPPRTVRSPSASPPWPPPPGARLPRVRPGWRSRGQPGPAPSVVGFEGRMPGSDRRRTSQRKGRSKASNTCRGDVQDTIAGLQLRGEQPCAS